MSDNLPQELVTEILLKLHVKSILRCTCVCKSWYSLITSPKFISLHLNNQDYQILIRRCDRGVDGRVTEIFASFFDDEIFDRYTQFDVPFQSLNPYCYVQGYCNGLLCIFDRRFFYLWNPSIRKLVKLPEPIFQFDVQYHCHTVGFGFDLITNDYKVVRIVFPHNASHHNLYVEIYKLSTGVWHDITPAAPFYEFYPWIPALYLNGACHWTAFISKGSKKNMIVLFDLHDEMFREMTLPGNLVRRARYDGYDMSLFVSEDQSLCLVDCLFLTLSSTIDIWMMKMYGDSGSWVKQFTIRRDITFNVVVGEIYSIFNGPEHHPVGWYLLIPMASRKNGEILWGVGGKFLVSYNPAAGSTNYLGIYDNSDDAVLHVNTFKPSLILLDKQADCYDIESSNLCKRDPKDRMKKFLKAKTKRRWQRGYIYMIKVKAKRLRMIKQKKRVVQTPPQSVNRLRFVPYESELME